MKQFRERLGITRQELGDAVGYSKDQVASIELGRRPAKEAFTTAAERVLGTQGALAALQDEVDLAKLPIFFQDFAQLEADAVSRFSYDPLLVPGLLQTEAYARAVFEGQCPPMSADEVEQNVEARLARQRLLGREPLIELSFIIGDTALLNVIGGDAAMAEQRRRLVDVVQQRNMEIQVMRQTNCFHPGLNGPFVLLETDGNRRFGYIESQGLGRVASGVRTVGTLALRYGKLRSHALNCEESALFIRRLLGER
ncbi:helix-turn-helix domain-containing protein [Yinghuangia seranimata]|uniref:helix-turn-helix domain-containing protein n=1 Tax=Yinghuangia seranimata TaxID=408067 RepID=UPI00248B4EBA|nr:helix-turn-helix transcriptional regulator [Yinghuangia seranimata]MDI2132591.1 helix-turn-helix transcriptional regulator [Yinghuangia seranimata]